MTQFDNSLARGVRFTQDGTAWINKNQLGKNLLGQPSALLEQTRRYWGSALTPEAIETVLRAAEYGYMRDLTDLMSEALQIDGHFGMCVTKRHRSVAAARVNVVPAEGPGLDPIFAKECADLVRQQIKWLPNWRQILLRLEWGHFHGRAASEKIWDYNPNSRIQYRISDICWIHPRRLQFGPMRELRVRDDAFGYGWGAHGIGSSGLGINAGGSFGPGGFAARGLNLSEMPLKFITFTPQLYNEYAEREGYGPRCLYYSFFKRFGKREQMVLLEVFGKPWRILEHEPTSTASVQDEQLKSAAEVIDAMGANATGYAPVGMRVKTDQPAQGAGQVHENVIGGSNDEISKIALGEARTMSTKPSGLGSTDSAEAADVNAEVKSEDAVNLSDLLSEQLSVDIIVLNFGPDAAVYAPRIELTYEQAPDRDKETDRATKLVSAGFPLKKAEVYERIGYTPPEDGDELLVATPPAAAAGGGGFGAPEPGAPVGATGVKGVPVNDIAATNSLSLQRAARVLAMIGQIEGD
jgi:phage gp29-like protein